MSSQELNIDELDFDHCEDEQIHIPESVQGFGYLFALDPDNLEIKIVSENISKLFNIPLDDLVGTSFNRLVVGDIYENLLHIIKKYGNNKDGRLPFPLEIRREVLCDKDSYKFDSVIYTNDSYLILEIEPAAEFRSTYSAMHYLKQYAISVAPQFKSGESMERLTGDMVKAIKNITEMDRVIMYRFNEDWSSKVIAEVKEDDMVPYIDLYHPAGDIPSQARALYTKNWVRLMPDVEMEPSPLYPSAKEAGREPLDMSCSLIRNISPIHRQYVKNQKVRASMSFSLITYNQLWGMITCHHREPKYIPQNIRLECESLSQLFSWHLYAKEKELLLKRSQERNTAISAIIDGMSATRSIVSIFEENKDRVFDLTETDGFAFIYGKEPFTIGQVPANNVLEELLRVSKESGEEYFITKDITEHIPEENDLNGIRGVLLIKASKQHDYYTAWFRREHQYIQQ